ncbi:SMI1/KNR4 family protein [Paenibacillus amylolyticus]|uniref:SMI1/KNR4 family protein n=1 Tax=Paenibacillus amylolyticus TaxID=1451 RepID=UPI003EB82BDB
MSVIKAFREMSIQNDGRIDIITYSGKITVINKFKPSATEDKIKELTNYFSTSLPSDYISFLRESNGASLFEHLEYGGENFLYSVQDVMYYNEASDRRIVIANILEDRILIDLDRWSTQNQEYLLLCESSNPVEYSGDFHSNFETWLERFIIAQGSKFWYWRTDRI